MDACDDLFWDSPLSSEYEAFAQEQGAPSSYDSSPEVDATSDEFVALIFDAQWETMPSADRTSFCEGYNLFGPELGYEYFAEGYGEDAPSLTQFRDYFNDKC